MAQNEMKAKPALPERVRSMEGLGGAGGTAALALAAETLAEPERRATLSIGVVFTTASVARTEPSTAPTYEAEWRGVRSRGCARTETKTGLTLRATSGVVLCCRRAARRRTGSHHKVHALAVSRAKDGAGNMAVVLCSKDFLTRSSEASNEQVVQIGAICSGRSDA